MKLIRYQTSPLLTASRYPTLREEMDRLFDVAFPAVQRGQFPVDLFEDKEAFTVQAELPGFRKEEIAVEVEGDLLTVTAQQKTEGQERRFTRALALPENVNVEKIGAAYENGVLTVTLPKREEVKPKPIAVEVK